MTNDWSILKMINWMTEYLEKNGISEPRLNTEHLLAYSLKLKRLDLYLQFERILSSSELAEIKALIKRRVAREPLQYIIGTQPFRHVNIKVNKDVLIPRPETEVVVGEALKLIPEDSTGRILELGVGSGAILAALADERKSISLVGTEISEAAFKIAQENTIAYKDRLEIRLGNLFEPVGAEQFDLIISNPPYVPNKDLEILQSEVKDFEPKIALIGGEDGLDFYRLILNDAVRHLSTNAWLVLELGDGQGSDVRTIAEKRNAYKNISIQKDLGGKDRVFLAQNDTVKTSEGLFPPA